MNADIDTETALHLRALRGRKIVRVVGRLYPNPASYDLVQLVGEDGNVTMVDLRTEDVNDTMEVCRISARAGSALVLSGPCDDMRLDDFRVEQVLVLRRAEWISRADEGTVSVGNDPQTQHVSDPDEVPPWIGPTLVDAGVMFVDVRGSTLLLQADTFPMVMQCRYTMGASRIPLGQARPIGD